MAPIEIIRAEAEVARSQQDLTISETNLLQQETVLKNALSRTGVSTPGLADARIIPTDTIDVPEKEPIRPVQDLVAERIHAAVGTFSLILPQVKAGKLRAIAVTSAERDPVALLETVSRSELRDKAKPGQQVVLPPTAIYDDGNATLSFTPSPEAAITKFVQGQHVVQVIFWKVTEDRSHSHSYSWTFSVY